MINNIENGFTLTEMMVTVAVLAVLMSIAAPSYQRMIVSTRMSSQANELLSMIHFARSEAIKRNTPATICKSSNGSECTTVGAWDQGWIVFSDSGVLGIVDGTDSVLRVHNALTGNSSLVASGGITNFISLRNT